ncbi:MAG: sugar ABC transporter substrate-binding protein [Actinomycetota bacterium]|nr:sugar ABC transporter substrate-binding protein [Actinomycetota bacterium]
MKKCKVMKIFLLVSVMLVLTLLLSTACKGKTSPAENETTAAETTTAVTEGKTETTEEKAETSEVKAGSKKKVLGIVMIDLVNQFFVEMVEGGNFAAEDFGVEAIWKSSDGNIEKQIALVENFIEQKVDCILVNPLDNDALRPVVLKASEAGIPTITMAAIVDAPTNYNTFYNDYADTKIIAKILANLVDKKGKVALIYGNKGNLVSDLRQDGFMDGMADFPDIKVIQQPSNWDPATGLKAIQDIMSANPDLKGYHCVSDAVTLATYQAVKSAGKTDLVVTSYDGNIEGSEAVKNGEYMANVLLGSKRVGYWNVKIGSQLANGERPEEHTLNLPTHLIMNDDLKEKVLEWGIAEGASIITPDKAIELFNAYREELGPEK